MAEIHKLKKGNATIFPATVARAVYNEDTGQSLEQDIADLVPKELGKSLIADSEIRKLDEYPVIGIQNGENSSKYLRGDGTFAEIAVGSGGFAANLYMSNVTSVISGYKTLSYVNDTTPTTITGTSTNNVETLIEEFAFPLSLGTSIIDSGSWKFSIFGKVSSATGQTFARLKIYTRSNAGSETQLFVTDSVEIDNTVEDRIVFETIEPQFSVLESDKLIVKLYAVTNSNTAKTLSVIIGGSNPSYFNTPLAPRHSQLRDPNGDPNIQHMTAEEKFAVGGLARKAFGYRFDGVDDVITVNNNNLLDFANSGFTAEIIFRKTDDIGLKNLLIKRTYGSVISGWGCRLNTGRLSWFLKQDETEVSFDSVAPSAKNNNHAIFTIKDNVAYIYLNGELVGNKAFDSTLNFNTASGLKIGEYASHWFNGSISLIRIYKRGFDQSDVDYYYNAGRPDLSRLNYADKINKTSTGCVLELLPENATPSKWLDTQNSLDGTTTGNPTVNYGNVVPEPYTYPFKKYIGLEQNGNGSGLARFSVITNKTGKATMYGGIFVDGTGVNEIGKELTLYKDIQTNVYVKLLSQYAELEIDNLIYISDFAKGNNDPVLAPLTSELPIKSSMYGTATTVVNKLYGNVSLIPRNVIDLRLATPTNIDGLTTGDYKELPRGLEYLFLNSTKISGNLSGIPRKVKVLYIGNSTGISGLIKDIPDSCVRLTLSGTNTVSGNLSDLKGTIELMTLYGINVTYSGNLKFNASVDTIIISPTSNIFTSAMTDQIFIDLAAQVTTAVGSKVISLTGNCGAPTAASADARAKLSLIGFTITTN